MSALTSTGRFSHLFEPIINSASAVWDTRLAESDNFIAVPTLGSLVPGWVLLIPKRHVFSFQQLNTQELTEAQELADFISSTLSRNFGPVTTFEHGASHSGSVLGCGVDHAHLHLVSLEANLLSEALRDEALMWDKLPHWSKLQEKVSNGSEYLLMSNTSIGAFVTNDAPSTNQYFRRLIAKLHGKQGQWDYRSYPFVENAQSTVDAFSSGFFVNQQMPINPKSEFLGGVVLE